ncbi:MULTISPECIES: hypothetical protein [unclassified Wolbachia]|nr:hypothetical protein [Wolbachia endosymbiont (group B) of Episyrphus balteatus]
MTPLGTAVIKEPVSAIRMTPSWMEITSRTGMTAADTGDRKRPLK